MIPIPDLADASTTAAAAESNKKAEAADDKKKGTVVEDLNKSKEDELKGGNSWPLIHFNRF